MCWRNNSCSGSDTITLALALALALAQCVCYLLEPAAVGENRDLRFEGGISGARLDDSDSQGT